MELLRDPGAASGLLLFCAAPLLVLYRIARHERLLTEEKFYEGTCHCGEVQFTVKAPRHLVAWDCNCSICRMKKNWHFIIPARNFHLTAGADHLTEYRFNTKVARHLFCKKCGVQAYYVPRSNPDGVAVTLACLKPDQVESHEIRTFDGSNWESFFVLSNIRQFSKT